MYELGIRHAASLPHVILGWKGQSLPFDVSGQRALVEDRRPLFFSETRKRVAEAIAQAAAGNFYRPMDAVERMTAIQKAAATSGDPIPAMAAELAQLRTNLADVEHVMREIKKERSHRKLQELLSEQLLAERLVQEKALRALEQIGTPPPGRSTEAQIMIRRFLDSEQPVNLRSEGEDPK